MTEAFNTLNLSTKRATCPAGQFKISWAVKGKRGKPGKPGATAATARPGTPGPERDPGSARRAEGTVVPPVRRTRPAQVLSKLLTVDGPGSGLDADLLGGLPSSDWQRRVTGTCAANTFMQQVAADGDRQLRRAVDRRSRSTLTQTTATDDVINASITNNGSGARVISVDNQASARACSPTPPAATRSGASPAPSRPRP